MNHLKLFEGFSRSEWIDVFDMFKNFTDEFDALNIDPDRRHAIRPQIYDFLKTCSDGIYYEHSVPNSGSHFFSIYFVGQSRDRREEAIRFLQTNIIDRVKSIGHQTAMMNDAPVEFGYGTNYLAREKNIHRQDMYINVSENPYSESHSSQEGYKYTIANMIKKNLPEEIYHIRDIIMDLKDECKADMSINIQFVCNYPMNNSFSITLDANNLDPIISDYLPVDINPGHYDPQNWTYVYKKIKQSIEIRDTHTFKIYIIASKNAANTTKHSLEKAITEYDRTQKSMRMFNEPGANWITIQIKK